jgi:hypothetical protein
LLGRTIMRVKKMQRSFLVRIDNAFQTAVVLY